MQCYNPGSQVEGGEGDRQVNQAITGVIIWHSDIEQPANCKNISVQIKYLIIKD